MAELYYHDSKTMASNYPAQVTPPIRQRRSRTMFSDASIAQLEAAFAADPYPDINAREEMADSIGVAEARIQTWFQNKRSRTRRKINNGRLGASPFTPTSMNTAPSNSSTSPGGASSTRLQRSSSPKRNPEKVQPGSRELATDRSFSQNSPSPSNTRGSPPPRRSSPVAVHKTVDTVNTMHNDSGVLDLSSRYHEIPSPSHLKNKPTPRQGSPVHPDAGRPFFTPWATPSPLSRPAPGVLATPPGVVATPLMMATGNRFHMAPQFNLHSPWMFGFSPSFNPQDKSYFLQPLPTSPFLHYVADDVPPTPGFAPYVGGLGTPLSASHKKGNVFVFPEVQHSAPADEGSSPSPVQGEGSEGQVTSSSSSATASQAGLSASPGSDSGSRSSGYSSRENDSPINVCD